MLPVTCRCARRRLNYPMNCMKAGDLKLVQRQLTQATTHAEARVPLQICAKLAAAGDSEALETLLENIDRLEILKPAIRRQLFEPTDQQDAEQDAMMQVARSIQQFRAESNILTWLHRLATNSSLMLLRRRKELSQSNKADLAAPHVRFTSITANQSTVRDAIEALPEPYRQVVELREIKGLSYQEVADATDTNINTTRGRIAKGRALLADYLEQQSPSTDLL